MLERMINFLKRIWLKFFSNQKSTPRIISLEEKIAFHEAGHAIAAWICPHVQEVSLATIESEFGGMVLFKVFAKTWPQIVISLAGIAAEQIIFGKFNAKPAETDLLSARALCKKINIENIPIKSRMTLGLSFDKIFLQKLSKKEKIILSAAYLKAKEILSDKKILLIKLTSSLLLLKSMNEKQLSLVLGKRDFIKILASFNGKDFL